MEGNYVFCNSSGERRKGRVSGMKLLTGGIFGAGLLKFPGRLRQILLHRYEIIFLIEHFFTKQITHEARDACILFRGPYSGPTGYFLVERDSDVFHNDIILEHESRVNKFFQRQPGAVRIVCRGSQRSMPLDP